MYEQADARTHPGQPCSDILRSRPWLIRLNMKVSLADRLDNEEVRGVEKSWTRLCRDNETSMIQMEVTRVVSKSVEVAGPAVIGMKVRYREIWPAGSFESRFARR